MDQPLIAITMGDPAGIGPEIIVAAWRDGALRACCRQLVIGRPQILRRAAKLLGVSVEVAEVASPEQEVAGGGRIRCLTSGSPAAEEAPPGVVDARGGQAAYDALVLAADLALAGRVDAIATAPLNKAALWSAGHHYPGHTELLAERCGVRDVAMMLYLAPGGAVGGPAGLGVVHVTLHTALRDVFDQLTTDAVLSKTRLVAALMRPLCAAAGGAEPRIGVAALNPHAGEAGLFGDEEERIIRPAVELAEAEGLTVQGPLPSDTLMLRAANGEFDAVVAMYHDQGHVAVKLFGMHHAVNITLGLPIIRTSVAHGTAFDLAWRGEAESAGMAAAVQVAAQLARRKSQLAWKPPPVEGR